MGYANSTFLDADDVYAILKKDIKDINGEIEDLSKLTKWLGVTTTPITENSTVNPIMISGISVMAVRGDIAKYGDDNFKFTDVGTWQYYYDKTDVYTKDEVDTLLDDKVNKVQGKGLSTNDFTDAYKNKVDNSEALLKDNAPKNLLPLTLDGLKVLNKGEYNYEWTDNVCYDSTAEITYTVNTDEAGRVESISVSGTADTISQFMLTAAPTLADETYEAGSYIASTDVSSMPEGVYLRLRISGTYINVADEETVTLDNASGIGFSIRVMQDVMLDGLVIKPMFRRAAVTDGAFEVAYRTQKELDADLTEIEDRLDNLSTDYNDLTNKPSINNVTLTGNKTLSDLGIISGSAGVTVLYNNPTPTVNPQTAALSQPYTDFDFIYITWKLLSGSYNPITLVLRPEDIPAYSANDTIPIDFSGNDGYIKFPTTTSIELTQQPSGWSYVLVNVVGINLGGAMGRTVTTLFNNTGSTNPASITLPTAYTEFDEIIVAGYEDNWAHSLVEIFILSYTLKTNDHISLQSGDTYCNYLVASETGLTFANASNLVISSITGIKYDSDYITIDSEMSSTSENPVQNKVVKAYVDDLGLSVVNGQLCQTYNL